MTELHADDYGLFLSQSKRILHCCFHGYLNGTSIIPNGEDLNICLDMLPKQGLSLTIHLNLMQGHCLANSGAIPLLVDQHGIFRVRFMELLFCSLTGNYNEYKMQLKMEITAQIKKLLPFFEKNNNPIRVDGHAHWHMIPVVFDALMETIQECQFPVSYIRLPAEPIGIYLRNIFKIIPFPVINVIKTILLHLLVKRNRRKWDHILSRMDSKIFLGVLLSGCFDLSRMRTILPAAEQFAKANNLDLELLAHPGAVYEPSEIAKITNKNDLHFFTSPARALEIESLMHIRDHESVRQ